MRVEIFTTTILCWKRRSVANHRKMFSDESYGRFRNVRKKSTGRKSNSLEILAEKIAGSNDTNYGSLCIQYLYIYSKVVCIARFAGKIRRDIIFVTSCGRTCVIIYCNMFTWSRVFIGRYYMLSPLCTYTIKLRVHTSKFS